MHMSLDMRIQLFRNWNDEDEIVFVSSYYVCWNIFSFLDSYPLYHFLPHDATLYSDLWYPHDILNELSSSLPERWIFQIAKTFLSLLLIWIFAKVTVSHVIILLAVWFWIPNAVCISIVWFAILLSKEVECTSVNSLLCCHSVSDLITRELEGIVC
jgi:hypothetical protein